MTVQHPALRVQGGPQLHDVLHRVLRGDEVLYQRHPPVVDVGGGREEVLSL